MPRDDYSILEVTFRNGLFYRQTTKVRVTFDLPGGAPRSTSPVRVGSAFATFVAWAFGDIGRTDAQPILARLLKDDQQPVRLAAATAALELKPTGASGTALIER